jgi:hypothetical protein
MDYRSLTLLVSCVAVPALAFACGGKTGNGGNDGGPGSSSSSGGMSGSSSGFVSGSSSGVVSSSTSGGEPVDATPVIDSPAPIVCMSNGMGGSSGGTTDGGPPPCETSESETCSDGTTYSVDCQCPQGTCTCTVMSANGGSGGSVMYPGCPSCSADNLFSLCAFPQ